MEIERKRHNHSFISLAPLVDIVFLLLLFFLLTSQMIKETGLIKITLPKSKTAPTGQKSLVILSISEENRVYLADREVEIHNIKTAIEDILKRDSGMDFIQIRADKKADVGILVNVIDEIRLTGISSYSIITERN